MKANIERLINIAYESQFDSGLRGIHSENAANYCGRLATLYARATYLAPSDFVFRFQELKYQMNKFASSSSNKKKAPKAMIESAKIDMLNLENYLAKLIRESNTL